MIIFMFFIMIIIYFDIILFIIRFLYNLLSSKIVINID